MDILIVSRLKKKTFINSAAINSKKTTPKRNVCLNLKNLYYLLHYKLFENRKFIHQIYIKH